MENVRESESIAQAKEYRELPRASQPLKTRERRGLAPGLFGDRTVRFMAIEFLRTSRTRTGRISQQNCFLSRVVDSTAVLRSPCNGGLDHTPRHSILPTLPVFVHRRCDNQTGADCAIQVAIKDKGLGCCRPTKSAWQRCDDRR